MKGEGCGLVRLLLWGELYPCSKELRRKSVKRWRVGAGKPPLEGDLERFRCGLGLWFRERWAYTTSRLPGKPNLVLRCPPQVFGVCRCPHGLRGFGSSVSSRLGGVVSQLHGRVTHVDGGG